jgi:hypothetical protein
MSNTKLNPAEVDLLFDAQSAEIEALVTLARFEMAYCAQRVRLMDAAGKATEAREELFSRVVRAHGFDPESHEPNLDTQDITPKNGLADLVNLIQDPILNIQSGGVSEQEK